MNLQEKDKKEYSKIQITQAEYQLLHEEKLLCELKKELEYVKKNERNEISSLQERAAIIKDSIPDFDEATYNRYKEFFQIQERLNRQIKDIELREKELNEKIYKRTERINIIQKDLCKWKAMLNEIDKPTN